MSLSNEEFKKAAEKYHGAEINPRGGYDETMKDVRKLARNFGLRAEFISYTDFNANRANKLTKNNRLNVVTHCPPSDLSKVIILDLVIG